MEPNLQESQRILINKMVYTFHEPERGDIIVFHPYNNSQADFVKRVIGLPGETIEIKEGTVFIHKDGNILPLDEPYIKEQITRTFEGNPIPQDEYFVLGDNRNNSNDSRTGWTVKREDIIGKAWLLIWPPGEWGLVANHSLEEQLTISANE
jgi:signal peptidase I